MTPKISIFKKHFTSKIKKMPLTFLDFKNKVLMTYFMFVLLRYRSNEREQFQRKEGRSIDFHAIRNKKPRE